MPKKALQLKLRVVNLVVGSATSSQIQIPINGGKAPNGYDYIVIYLRASKSNLFVVRKYKKSVKFWGP